MSAHMAAALASVGCCSVVAIGASVLWLCGGPKEPMLGSWMGIGFFLAAALVLRAVGYTGED